MAAILMRLRDIAVAGLGAMLVLPPLCAVLRRPPPSMPSRPPIALGVEDRPAPAPVRAAFGDEADDRAGPPAPPPLPQLVAIVGRLPTDPQVMMRLPDDTLRTVAPGETIDGWRLARVSIDRVALTRGTALRLLVLPAGPAQ